MPELAVADDLHLPNKPGEPIAGARIKIPGDRFVRIPVARGMSIHLVPLRGEGWKYNRDRSAYGPEGASPMPPDVVNELASWNSNAPRSDKPVASLIGGYHSSAFASLNAAQFLEIFREAKTRYPAETTAFPMECHFEAPMTGYLFLAMNDCHYWPNIKDHFGYGDNAGSIQVDVNVTPPR